MTAVRIVPESTIQSANLAALWCHFSFTGSVVKDSFTVGFNIERYGLLNSGQEVIEKEVIKAPMPGKVIDVLVREGSTVLRGEPVLILEAMKMQNEIISPVNGTIVKVMAKANTNVMKDDLLIEIKL